MNTAVKERIDSIESTLDCYKKEFKGCVMLMNIESIGTIYPNGYGKTLTITPIEGSTARECALEILRSFKDAGHRAATAKKSFDEATGKITFELPGPDGWTVYVSGGEARCRVRRMVERVLVAEKPAVAAHYVERVRFEIENPEECGAEVKA